MDGPVDPSPVPSVESRARLLDLVRGYRISQAIYVVARQRSHERQLARPRPPRRRDVRLLPHEPGRRRRGRTGGRGQLLATILERYPRLRGILSEQPHVIEGARQVLDAAGVGDRCGLVGGSFFDAVPAGGDAYILRGIIPGFEDDQAVAILTNCRRAMATGARLLLVERYVATDPREALPVLVYDLEMLVNDGGRERTTDEYETLLARGGFQLAQATSRGAFQRRWGISSSRGDPSSRHRDGSRVRSPAP
jgi:O-methyltransferase domain